jgi:hypothetical protein
MFREEIIMKLLNNHESFCEYVADLSDEDFMYAPAGKWTPGQQAEHIYRSLKPLNLVMGFPKPVMKMIFGKSNRPSKDFDSLVEKYKNKLSAGGKASGRYIPEPVWVEQRTRVNEKILSTVGQLCKKVSRFSEEQLDHYILPHPLLGKLTLREMLYFTIYHVLHHKRLIEQGRSVLATKT